MHAVIGQWLASRILQYSLQSGLYVFEGYITYFINLI